MSKNKQTEPDAESDSRQNAQLNTLIGANVIHTLGQPAHFFKVQVRRLWGNCYRVNVLVGANITMATVANSYFIVADINGDIVESTPKISKRY